MPFHEIKLNDGRKIPQIGFGSWKIPKDVCAGQVDQAIDVGFDHIDTAQGECKCNPQAVKQSISQASPIVHTGPTPIATASDRMPNPQGG